ncbi:DNA-processing protein DprA [Mitsuaria sp. GD03876]|uniref:DNA-processing protein DprA n=1 Tax=Mitsuaria sp. GD03876 TaxID=2975399 RepID=UPI002446E340|nr:DNA-processing protein DprA [Mitsuaria sp. GD03876]MDH0864778.1 DNA-processing protein DprA [Mitsuaria sp. GD03876]
MSPDDLRDWLHLLSCVSRGAARRLLARHGSPGAVLKAGRAGWSGAVPREEADLLALGPPELDRLTRRTEAWLNGGERRSILLIGDDDYPNPLLQTADPPLMLYLDGRRELLNTRCVAVVGSRRPSPQGDENARYFAAGLGEAGLCVVSGLAQGIDGAAHEAALNTAGGTIAVLGTGPDKVYPLEHEELSRHVARRGLLVSEYFVGTPPMAPNFPQRNRIIAGLSEGCLVVEAAMKSGSLITARQASEAGREVFAVPGPIHAPQSKGCHHLLKQGACLVQELDDLLAELPAGGLPRSEALPLAAEPAVPASPSGSVVDDQDHPLLRAIGADTVSLEQLAQRSGWAQDELNATLFDLELEGRVARLPGALFQRRRRT